jgi:hypothetical protein
MAYGIICIFETHKRGIAYPCMRGDIERMAELTVRGALRQMDTLRSDCRFLLCGSGAGPQELWAGGEEVANTIARSSEEGEQFAGVLPRLPWSTCNSRRRRIDRPLS